MNDQNPTCELFSDVFIKAFFFFFLKSLNLGHKLFLITFAYVKFVYAQSWNS